MSGHKGNDHYRKGKLWQAAIKRAIARRAESRLDPGLDRLADKLIDAAEAGEQWALKELGDRIDGKPAQSVTVDGDGEGGPIRTVSEIALRAVDATDGRPAT